MPYASVAHVKARAGYLGGAWTETSTPGIPDIEGFLADVAAEIDAAITGLGFTPPEEGSVAALALRGLNADGALLLALDASWPAGEGPDAATSLQEAVRARYDAAWVLLLGGKHPATTTIDVGSETSVPSATDFWSENPDYGRPGYTSEAEPAIPNVALDPSVRRGMAL